LTNGKAVFRLGHSSADLKKPTICLFTAHSPAGGGGGAILRSLLPELDDQFEIFWRYLATKPAPGYESGWLGGAIIGSGGFFPDACKTASLLVGAQPKPWSSLIDKLLSVDCDAYWIVSHNEGLCAARDLSERSNRPIHLTVHDDWAGALCARSARYRLLAPLADRVTRKVLRRTGSVDVVSRGMREHYRRTSGVEASVCHRFLPELPSLVSQPDGPLTVGHIGSIYSAQELWCFADAFKRFCVERGERGRIRLWGCHLRGSDVPRHLEQWVDFCPNAAEGQVVLQLQQCHFVYAMYPFARRLRRFSQTSLPTKLSTYVLVQRPILGHGPADSSLAEFLRRTGLGRVWDNMNAGSGQKKISELFRSPVANNLWEQARSAYFGRSNVESLKLAFSRLVP